MKKIAIFSILKLELIPMISKLSFFSIKHIQDFIKLSRIYVVHVSKKQQLYVLPHFIKVKKNAFTSSYNQLLNIRIIIYLYKLLKNICKALLIESVTAVVSQRSEMFE